MRARMGIIRRLVHLPVWQLMLTVGWRLSAKIPLLTWLFDATWVALKLGSQVQEQMFWGREDQAKATLCLQPGLRNHRASLVPHSIGWGSYRGPSRLKGGNKTPPLSEGVSTSHVSRACGMDLSWSGHLWKMQCATSSHGEKAKFL